MFHCKILDIILRDHAIKVFTCIKVVIFCLCNKFLSSVNNVTFMVMFVAFFHAKRSLVLMMLLTQDC